ncbi:MAG: hypothetical protein IJV37_05475 [Bacteroidales bacterium]|nr:hypothetical protein [Bacteroidales bacterium]
MDILVSAGIALLIVGAFLKIKEKIRSARHEKIFDDAYRRWREEEISSQLASREKMNLRDDQIKRLKRVDRQFRQSQGFHLGDYRTACEQIYSE